VRCISPDDPSQLLHSFHHALGRETHAVVRAAAPSDELDDFARAVARGLSAAPRRVPCRFLYDARGSALYERITALPEYYPTRTEAQILADHAPDIARRTGPVTLVELGAGYSVKTEHLLAAYARRGADEGEQGARSGAPSVPPRLRSSEDDDHRGNGSGNGRGNGSGNGRGNGSGNGEDALTYVPNDVSLSALQNGLQAIERARPAVQVVGIHGTYEDAFAVLPAAAPTLVIFLGSTIGNLDDAEADAFWRRISAQLTPGDFVLLGADLVKDPALVEAAYNDAAGVTAEFTLNLFARMNRELGSGLDLSALRHEARWNPDAEQIETDVRFLTAQRLRVAPLQRAFTLEADERLRVEISRKFRKGALRARLAGHGLRTVEVYTDPQEWFGVFLLQKQADG
jgi:L-histidine N-alpha-methyltransferase